MSYKGRIVVTGAEEDLAPLASRVKRAGYLPLLLPTIEIEKKPLNRTSLAALKSLAEFDYLFFTSAHAAKLFGSLVKGLRIRKPPTLLVVAVGRATAAACARIGFKTDVVPKEFNVEEMLRGLDKFRGKKILFPRSAIAPKATLTVLRAKGAIVKAISLYKTMPVSTDAPSFKDIFEDGADAIIFMSPSSIAGFVKNLSGTILRKQTLETTALCIGPTTARAARAAGFRHIKIPHE